jgi:hypothetical protein
VSRGIYKGDRKMLKDILSSQKEFSVYDELLIAVENACCLSDINSTRKSCVYYMHNGHPEILGIWQDKYHSLKQCSKCGRPFLED